MLKIHHYSLQGWQLLRPSSGETGGHDPVPETAQRSAGETSAGSHWRKQHAESQSLSPTQKTLSQSEGIFHTRGLCNVIVLGQCSSTNEWANHAYSIYMYHCAKTLVLSYIAFKLILEPSIYCIVCCYVGISIIYCHSYKVLAVSVYCMDLVYISVDYMHLIELIFQFSILLCTGKLCACVITLTIVLLNLYNLFIDN